MLVLCVYNWFDDNPPRWPSGLAQAEGQVTWAQAGNMFFYFSSAMRKGRELKLLELKSWLTLLLYDHECVRESSLLCFLRNGVTRTLTAAGRAVRADTWHSDLSTWGWSPHTSPSDEHITHYIFLWTFTLPLMYACRMYSFSDPSCRCTGSVQSRKALKNQWVDLKISGGWWDMLHS